MTFSAILCNRYMTGDCSYGDDCWYIHDSEGLAQQPPAASPHSVQAVDAGQLTSNGMAASTVATPPTMSPSPPTISPRPKILSSRVKSHPSYKSKFPPRSPVHLACYSHLDYLSNPATLTHSNGSRSSLRHSTTMSLIQTNRSMR